MDPQAIKVPKAPPNFSISVRGTRRRQAFNSKPAVRGDIHSPLHTTTTTHHSHTGSDGGENDGNEDGYNESGNETGCGNLNN
ncbi:hypothetical protein SAMD00023353_4900110 [Rosellinia necatrix]|uniref:Uncharacterized protein n=1 Tax=Rosellinia necatrix TaxID=77044 RepID=A0A1S8AAQ0_ROSNE|nr:hypothetical protein SAMD00023353_4900110 [Rosellinia necatrix]